MCRQMEIVDWRRADWLAGRLIEAWWNLKYVFEVFLLACAWVQYGKLPVVVRLNDCCSMIIRHSIIFDRVVVKSDGCKCPYDMPLLVWEIMSCKTVDVCQFYSSCQFRGELKEIAEIYDRIDSMLKELSKKVEICVSDIQDVLDEVDSLVVFARMLEENLAEHGAGLGGRIR